MALRVKQFTKVEMYAQPHELRREVGFELDDSTLDTTIFPIAFYDEGLGTPTAQETHPENAAFVQAAHRANCFINSRINIVESVIRFSMNSKCLDDNLPAIRCAFMPIHMAFIDDYTAIDELSTLEVQDVLEMQTESTDNQGGPLYVAATDLPTGTAGISVYDSLTPFLDTTTSLEAVAFDPLIYYNMLHFMTNSGKLKAAQSGLKWFFLTQERPVREFRIRIRPKVKRMNKFTYFGVLAHVPGHLHVDQVLHTLDITAATQYVNVNSRSRYSEWNQDFNSRKV